MTNQAVGELIGLSHSAVSRLRKGSRTPSLDAMLRIANALDWPLDEQITAKIEGVYAPYLEGQIERLSAS
jgi:transcriptional regulator with XRE-family HTH domain